ncbi:MAG: hypothetical protein VX733_01755 [Candidatus Latescibacterota bacterium]|nr:hypothetical protein [Candidatus Latescibacterota bacterium]
MIDAIYAIIFIAFGSLALLAVYNYLIRGSDFREAITGLRSSLEITEEKVSAIRQELADFKFDTDIMDAERKALEKQTLCMMDLEERFQEQLATQQDKSDLGRGRL